MASVVLVAFALVLALLPARADGQVLEPPFDADYQLTDLGAPPGVPASLGGLTLKAGTTNRLLIGGEANTASGALYEIGLTRDAEGHITGFSDTAVRYADAAYNDGGVAYGPGGVLFLARWPVNELGQTKPGSAITDKVIDLSALGVTGSPGALVFVPPGQPGAGSLKLAGFGDGGWYDADVAPDGTGTYDLVNLTNLPDSTISGGPEGIIYVNQGSAEFPGANVIVSEWSAGTVGTYEVDGEGDPIPATRRTFISGLSGAEGAFVDPATGDFLFSTFGGGDRVIVVKGFANRYPRPGSGTPLRVPLVPQYSACTTPNAVHVEPLDEPSCSPAELESGELTTSTLGRGTGFLKLRDIVGLPGTPEDEADVAVELQASDVSTKSGADYDGEVILRIGMRITDSANEPAGVAPATVEDTSVALPVDCAPVGGLTGSNCNLTTTMDTVIPDFAKERKRAVISVQSVTLEDAGPNGTIAPTSDPLGLGCPPTCGDGDESTFLMQGLFAP